MLDAPRRGCLNIHASLLPRWRGAAPIQAAIMAGDAETGITIMRMDAGLDTGPMLSRGAVPITPTTTTPALHDALAAIGATLILAALADPPEPVPQPEAGATYAPKLGKQDARIDWTQSAEALERRIRALNPWPGTETTLGGAPFKIHAATLAEGAGPPGVTINDRLSVACGIGALVLTRVQAPGRSAMPAADFLRGHPVAAGTRLG
jgi:methionyl-tRNA formyltransferase